MAATTPSPTMVDDQGDQRCRRRQQLNEISVLSHSGQFPEEFQRRHLSDGSATYCP